MLFMPTDMDLAQFRADWIAVHEISHLLHPFVRRGDAWLSTGDLFRQSHQLASYLQGGDRLGKGEVDDLRHRRMRREATRGTSALCPGNSFFS